MSQGFGNVYKKMMIDKRLSKNAKLIHCYFCSYAGSGDTAFPSVSLICYHLELNEDTYYEHLLYLKAFGYITIEPNRDSKGKFKNNIYTIEQFPEQNENDEYKKKIEEIIDKRKKKNDKARGKKKTNPSPDNPGTDEPGTDNPSTDKPGTNNNSSTTNSLNTIFFSIWDIAKDKLSKQLAEHTYNDFVASLTPFSYEDGVFIFLCPDEWLKSVIEMRYIDNIKVVLSEVCKLHNINDFEIQIKV